MNGNEDTPRPKDGYFRRLRRRTISHLFKPVLPAAPVLDTQAGHNIAGPRPPSVKACNDNQRAEDRPSPQAQCLDISWYICAGIDYGCRMYSYDDGTKALWCQRFRKWQATECGGN